MAVRQPVFSLIGSAKLNGLDPEVYLLRVPSRIAEHLMNGKEEPLRSNVAANQASVIRTAA